MCYVLTLLLILTADTVNGATANPKAMQAQLCLPFGVGVVAFEPSQLGVGALVLAAVHSSRHLVRSVGTFVASGAHEGSIDANFRHTFVILRAGEQGCVASLVAPLQRVTGVGEEQGLQAAAVLVNLAGPVLRCFLTGVP